MKLISNPRQAWKYFSTIALGLGTALQSAWLAFPDDLKHQLPGKVVSYFLACLLLWGLIGRFIAQPQNTDK